ncbi:MAG: hypothetical protein AAGG07_10755 [Planctomycetota bacterium]
MLERLPSLALVTLVTLLIWVFAEGQSVRRQTRDLDISIAMPAESRLLTVLDDDWSARAEITLEGSAASLDAALRQLRPGVRLVAGENFSDAPGEFSLDLLDAIRGTEMLRGLGVTVAAVEPPELRVRVERLVTATAVVRASAPEGVLAGPPTILPAEVTLSFPGSLRDALPDPLELTAVLDRDQLEALDRGRQQTVTGVRLSLPEPLATARGVRAEPGEVNVTLTLVDTTRSVDVPIVPVHVRLSPLALSDWDIELADPFVRGVTIRGPGEAIEALPRNDSGELRLIATLALSPDEIERAALEAGGELLGRVSFDAYGPGLSFETADQSVRVRVSRREAASEGG